MVEGDRIAVDVDVGKGCNIVVTTQAATKVLFVVLFQFVGDVTSGNFTRP